MILRRLVTRGVLTIALVVLVYGFIANWDEEVASRIADRARVAAEIAKSRVGYHSQIDASDGWDEVINVQPLIRDLEKGKRQFDWSDWLDLDKTRLYDRGDLDPKLYPYLHTLKFNERPEMPYLKQTTPQEQAMVARLYCRWNLPSPFRVVPLADPAGGGDDILKNGLRTAPMVQYPVEHAKKMLRHRQHGHTEPTVYYNASEPLVPELKAQDLSPVDLLFPPMNASLFHWDGHRLAGEADDEVENHALSVKLAIEEQANAPKYFQEVEIENDPIGYGVHYDWRFFRGILPHPEHVAATHALARAWQQFAEQMGISYWYAHGSLLGYHWNGMAMPWDTDHDIQVPVQELNRLARDFNRTLVVQHPREGYRKYLIDVGPNYVQRQHGNGMNLIDARFIDVDTGAYIDITGLAGASQVIMCKNRHRYSVDDYFRLRRTMYEGYPALVPSNFIKMLRREYPHYNRPKFEDWSFNYKVRLWEFSKTCKEYVSQYDVNEQVYCFPREEVDQCKTNDLYTCDKYTLEDYDLTKEITQQHDDEAAVFKELGELTKKTDIEGHSDALNSLFAFSNTYFPPFHNSSTIEIEVAGSSEASRAQSA